MSHLVLRSISNLVFKVKRQEPELIRPAKPTPKEIKLLSDIDDQDTFRLHITNMSIYPGRIRSGSYNQPDPVRVIRAALAEALVYYYPLAGRLKEIDGGGRKLAVDCTGEGVIFIEADADIRLEDFGDEICPPFHWYEEFLFNHPSLSNIVQSPLLLIQVTRLTCGGFVLGNRLNHTICDAVGLLQFITAMAEIANGASQPSVLPVWKRELIKANDPPLVTCSHREYDSNKGSINIPKPMEMKSFFFGPNEISTLRRLILSELQGNYTTFDLLFACLWRCQTIALQYNPHDEVRAVLSINARSKFDPPLPIGYYGNAFAVSNAITTFENLSKNPLEYVIELIRAAKDVITTEHLRSLPNFLVVQGRPMITTFNTYIVSDIRRGAFTDQVDFGWGKAAYAGVADPFMSSFFMSYRNSRGTQGILVPVNLPPDAMERFIKELDILLKTAGTGEDKSKHYSTKIRSSI